MAEFETHQNRSAEAGAGEAGSPNRWLDLARRSAEASKRFIDTNVRRQWEQNLRSFQNQHPSGSKYYSADYKHRSKIYRPKTRSTVRKSEGAVAAAFFSTADVLSIKAPNDNDVRARASAAINKELVQHHLTKNIPWFLTVLGAWQDGRVQGICVSRQTWRHQVRQVKKMVARQDLDGTPLLDEAGRPIADEVVEEKVILDQPQIDLVPPENLRIDPGADWRDPLNSSPFLQVLWPMYVVDVKERMAAAGDKNPGGKWLYADDAKLARARESEPDSTRTTREKNRTDSKEVETGVKEFDTIWCIENFMRVDGDDWHYWTLGTHHLLTEPTPAAEVYPHAPRPYVMGLGAIETHTVYPESLVGLVAPLQQEANEVANQRLDNVKLAMNGRYFVRRGKQVDLTSLLRSTPGGASLMNDPTSDVVWHRPDDVTSSSYAEQDRINVDFDELAGAFSAGSVQSNRQLNETVGGMNLLSASANGVTEYDLRVFAETWAEPTLRQVVKLVQHYETDERILAMAADKAQLYQKFGVNQIDDALLEQELTTMVNVGIGSTDPTQQVQRLGGALQLIASIPPWLLKVLNLHEVATEIFGKSGYRDGERFLNLGDNPEVKQLQMIIQQLEQQMEGRELEAETKVKVAEIGAQSRLAEQQMEDRTKIQIEQMRARAAAIEQFRTETMSAAQAAMERRHASREADKGRRHDAGSLVFQARAKAAERPAQEARSR